MCVLCACYVHAMWAPCGACESPKMGLLCQPGASWGYLGLPRASWSLTTTTTPTDHCHRLHVRTCCGLSPPPPSPSPAHHHNHTPPIHHPFTHPPPIPRANMLPVPHRPASTPIARNISLCCLYSYSQNLNFGPSYTGSTGYLFASCYMCRQMLSRDKLIRILGWRGEVQVQASRLHVRTCCL